MLRRDRAILREALPDTLPSSVRVQSFRERHIHDQDLASVQSFLSAPVVIVFFMASASSEGTKTLMCWNASKPLEISSCNLGSSCSNGTGSCCPRSKRIPSRRMSDLKSHVSLSTR